MYLHSNTNVASNPARRIDNLTPGMGFGGTLRNPRLFVVEYVTVSHQNSSYELEYLNSPPRRGWSRHAHRIESFEVYALGDAATVIGRGFEARDVHRDVADATLRNARGRWTGRPSWATCERTGGRARAPGPWTGGRTGTSRGAPASPTGCRGKRGKGKRELLECILSGSLGPRGKAGTKRGGRVKLGRLELGQSSRFVG